eukprot:gene26769-33402_t
MPGGFVGAKYDWEEWDVSKWPNVVMLDFTLNTLASDGWESTKSIDKIIRGINQKYFAKNLQIPEYYLLELVLLYGFRVDAKKHNQNITFSEALNRYNNLSSNPSDSFFAGNGFDRGCVNCAYFNSYAQFYGYPVVSFRDAVWPSFLRHHFKSPNTIWRYSGDAIHLSDYGRYLLQKYIFAPFFKDVMKPRESDKNYKMVSKYSHFYEHDVRMFAPELTVLEVAKWSSWGNEKNTLKTILSPYGRNLTGMYHAIDKKIKRSHNVRNNWHFTSTPGHKHDKGHICYGSTKLNTTNVMNLRAPLVCNHTACAIQLSSVFSWNQTHFGAMECSVYRNISAPDYIPTDFSGHLPRIIYTTQKQLLLSMTLIGSLEHKRVTVHNTLPLDTVLYSNATQ